MRVTQMAFSHSIYNSTDYPNGKHFYDMVLSKKRERETIKCCKSNIPCVGCSTKIV